MQNQYTKLIAYLYVNSTLKKDTTEERATKNTGFLELSGEKYNILIEQY